jgi:hypothetical protein
LPKAALTVTARSSKRHAVVPSSSATAIANWFSTAQEAGEYIGIRFGRLAPGATEPEWFFLPHSEVDGIGGFARLLRQRGADIRQLPKIRHFSEPSITALIRALPRYLAPRYRVKWSTLDGAPRPGTSSEPPSAIAWHVFSEEETTQIRRVCRKASYTVNSFLLKHLTKAIRPFLLDQSAVLPWMVPVNLRGRVVQPSDEENHSSYVSVRVRSYETVYDVHRSIYSALAAGEHWANWDSYKSGNVLPSGMRRVLLRMDRATAQWNIGGFSNLGVWDGERDLQQPGCVGGWLFAPPVLRCQMLGAGCVTFQNHLGLLIQAHPELTTSSASPKAWMQNWVREIEIDLDSVLAEPIAFHASPLRASLPGKPF